MEKINERAYDMLKAKVEKAMPDLKVKSIVDLDEKFVVVTCQPAKGDPTITGISYKINKDSGVVMDYSPMSDADAYFLALRKRAKFYK